MVNKMCSLYIEKKKRSEKKKKKEVRRVSEGEKKEGGGVGPQGLPTLGPSGPFNTRLVG